MPFNPRSKEPPAASDQGERDRARVRITAGVGYTNDPAAAAHCRGIGYTVEDRRPPAATTTAGDGGGKRKGESG